MKRSRIFMGLIGLMVLYGIIAMLPFGCSQLPDTGGNTWKEGGGPAAGTYVVMGNVYGMDNVTPVKGAICTLESSAKSTSTYSATCETSVAGLYNFASVPTGSYNLTISAVDRISTRYALTVSANTTTKCTSISTSDWATFVGDSSYTYDPSRAYVIIQTQSGSAGISSVAIASDPTTYLAKGYVNDSGVVNYTATGTYSNGKAFFYGLTAGVSYAFTGTSSTYSLTSVSGVTPEAGMINAYIMAGTSVSPSPSPAVSGSPSPSPSASASSSPSVSVSSSVSAAELFHNPAATKRMAWGFMLMCGLSCLVLLKKEK